MNTIRKIKRRNPNERYWGVIRYKEFLYTLDENAINEKYGSYSLNRLASVISALKRDEVIEELADSFIAEDENGEVEPDSDLLLVEFDLDNNKNIYNFYKLKRRIFDILETIKKGE